MSEFLNSKYAPLTAYTPGEQPRDRKYIKLNTNELPYPPSDAVIEAAKRAAGTLNLYCDPTAKALVSALAERYGVGEDCVAVGNGSDEVLSFIFMGFCERGVVIPEISYGFYPVYADLYRINAEKLPLLPDLSIDPRDYYGKNKTIVIANPNAPTGLALSRDQIEYILIENPSSLVCIDEAYVDFGGESCVPLLSKYKNLLVVMTFSKSRALAGGRLGFALGAPSVIADINKLKYSTNPYNVNTVTQACGIAALSAREYYDGKVETVKRTRQTLTDGLRRLGFTVADSAANFVFAAHETLPGRAYFTALRESGVLVRHFNVPEIENYNRISVGTPEEIEKLLEITEKILYNVR